MAGDWIKIEIALPDKPEVVAMASMLDIDQDAVAGKLIRIWGWVDQHTTDGNAPSVTRALFDRLASVKGFADAMAKVGWLETSGDRLSIPNFDRHSGQTGKTRALTAKRAAKHRTNSNAESNASAVTTALPTEDKREDKEVRGNTNTPQTPAVGGPNSDKPKRSKPEPFDPTKVELPANLRTTDFESAWRDWCRYRATVRKTPVSKDGASRSLAMLSRQGPLLAIELIERAIRSDWKGLHEDHNANRRTTQPNSADPGKVYDASAAERDPSIGTWGGKRC